VVDFIKRIIENLEEEKKSINGFEVIRKDTFKFLSDKVK
jgi:hypothetical protein